MKDRDYRELQLSRPQLISIFLGMLIIGIFIFLLGISVGKRQAQIAGKAPQKEGEKIKEKATPAQAETSLISEEIRSAQKIQEEAKEPEKEQQPAPVAEKATPYYIQIAALNSKEAALALSEKFKQDGYPSLVLDPFPSDRRDVFRVRVGGFETKEEAEKVRTKLKPISKKKVDYFIVRD